MSKLSEFEDELISGFLDGQLNSEEVRSVQDLLVRSAEANLRLNALRQLSSEIKRLPPAGLGADFPARVIASARTRVIESGASNEHHVLLGGTDHQLSAAHDRVHRPASASNWSINLRWAGGLSALAASLLFVAYMVQQPAFVNPTLPISSGAKEQVSDLASPPELVSNSTGVSNSPLAVAIEESSRDSNATLPISQSDSRVPGVPVQDRPAALLSMFLVVDVSLSKNAWQEDAFGKVLEGAGIAIGTPIVANDELQKAVEDSLVVINTPQSKSNASDVPSVALLLVQSDAKSLDRAMMALYARQLEFPELSFNMAYNQSDKDRRLFGQLKSGGELAVNQGMRLQNARPIVVRESPFEGISGAAQFSGRSKRSNLVSSANRSKGWPKLAADLGDVSMNPQTEALFVIRQLAGTQ